MVIEIKTLSIEEYLNETTQYLKDINDLKKSMKGSDFVFIMLIFHIANVIKINLNRYATHIDSPDWIKNEKATVNPKNNVNKKNWKTFRKN